MRLEIRVKKSILENENMKEKIKMSIVKDKYNVITLCGSIRFKNEFMKVQEELTLDWNIVFIPNFFNNLKG